MSTYGSRLAEKAHEPGKAMRWLWLSLLLLFVDQASKYLASTMLAHGGVPAAPFFNWVHRHNTGRPSAFSRMSAVGSSRFSSDWPWLSRYYWCTGFGVHHAY